MECKQIGVTFEGIEDPISVHVSPRSDDIMMGLVMVGITGVQGMGLHGRG
jgi:hypothetical protein